MTPEEQRDALDGRLRVALGQFDEMLLEEQQALEEKQRQDPVQGREDPGQGGSGPGGSSDGMTSPGERSGSQGGASSSGPSSGGSSGGGGGGEDRATGTVGGENSGNDPRVPADVGDGRDDDVVARQLREAAVKEEDPELREKLWDEYRQYKKSSGS